MIELNHFTLGLGLLGIAALLIIALDRYGTEYPQTSDEEAINATLIAVSFMVALSGLGSIGLGVLSWLS